MLSHLTLHEIKQLSPSVSLQADDNDHQFIIITHDKFEAAFTRQGAHLIHFQAAQQPPLIYLSKTAIFSPQKAVRGGVPICWPWFSTPNASLGNDLPSHGFARTSLWDIKVSSDSSQGIEIEFTLTASADSKKQWPHDFLLTLKATLNERIALSLLTQNTGNNDFNYGGALHTYLQVKAIQACEIRGLATQYTDSLMDGQPKQATDVVTINAELDVIHDTHVATIHVNDAGYSRHIEMNNTGNDAVVVWNPWINKAKQLMDMPDNDYQSMLCIESAITSLEGVKVSPGQTHSLTTTIQQRRE